MIDNRLIDNRWLEFGLLSIRLSSICLTSISKIYNILKLSCIRKSPVDIPTLFGTLDVYKRQSL